MYTIPPKKLLIINILEILRRESDENHRLTQQDIIQRLASEYQMKADRKAVKRNLMDLIDFGCNIEYREVLRKNKAGEEESICTDWYLVRDFSDAELRLIIESVLFSRHMPDHQRRQLIGKLEGLSNRYFSSRVRHIHALPLNTPENRELFYTVEILDEAISGHRQVEFTYNSYDVDFKLHPRCGSDGKPRRYCINPYRIAAANGRYYLICNNDPYEALSNYRLDRITGIKILNSVAKPIEQVQGQKNGLDLPHHMAEHIYMFSGKSERVTFRAERGYVGKIIDWFGCEVQFSEVTEAEVTACVTVNPAAMRRWALQYAPHVRVTSPDSLVEAIKEDIAAMAKRYKDL